MPVFLQWQRFFALAVAAVLTAALTLVVASAPAEAARRPRNQKIINAAQTAKNQIGDPYVYGAEGPNAFDCSGLLYFSFGRRGISVPRTSDAQADYARPIRRRELRRGDLMAFHSGGDVYHIGMFIGRDSDGRPRMVHSSRSGVPVKVDTPWTSSWYAVTLRPRPN